MKDDASFTVSLYLWSSIVDGLIVERLQVTEIVDYLMQIGVLDYTEDGKEVL